MRGVADDQSACAFSKIVSTARGQGAHRCRIGRFERSACIDFSNYFFQLGALKPEQATKIGHAAPYTYKELTDAGVAVFGYGTFLTILLNFLILAFIIFWMVKMIAHAKAHAVVPPPAPAPAATPEDVLLLREIRDALKRP